MVTGLAGFIGAEVGRQLLEDGVEVVGIDNLNDYYDPRLKHHRLETLRKRHSFEFHDMDVEDERALESLFAGRRFDAVFNLAARAGVGRSVKEPHLYFRTNLVGTLNLLQAMVRHSVDRLVLASTSSVYSGEPMPFHEDAPVNRPISPYAASKKAAEQVAYTFHHHYGLNCVVVRYFTVFGPAGRPDMSPFRFTAFIDQGRPLELFGDGDQRRDFTYVEDIGLGTRLAAELNGYEIVNLGGGRDPVTINTLIAALERGLGKKAIIDRRPALLADMRDTRADISKAKRVLGWEPKTSLEDGLARTLEWHQANRDLVARLRL